MKKPLVTIIIPFYNDERFLERAVLSALGQTYENIEVLLVNDGSTDSSCQIASGLNSGNDKIVLINSEHHSIGRARNLGVQKALGKYIAFLDSDDEMEKDAVQHLVFIMETQSADAVLGGFGLYNMKGDILNISRTNHMPDSLNNIEAAIALCKEKISRVVWAKLFKTEIARQISFPEGIWFEDGPYLMAYFYKCSKNILLTDILTIKHYSRHDSVTRQLFTQKRIEDTYTAFTIELRVAKNFAQYQLIRNDLFAYYQRALMNCLVILTTDRKRVDHLNEVEINCRAILSVFFREMRENMVYSGPRTRIDKVIIRLNEIIGWNVFYNLFPLLKRSLFKKIALIRSLKKL